VERVSSQRLAGGQRMPAEDGRSESARWRAYSEGEIDQAAAQRAEGPTWALEVLIVCFFLLWFEFDSLNIHALVFFWSSPGLGTRTCSQLSSSFAFDSSRCQRKVDIIRQPANNKERRRNLQSILPECWVASSCPIPSLLLLGLSVVQRIVRIVSSKKKRRESEKGKWYPKRLTRTFLACCWSYLVCVKYSSTKEPTTTAERKGRPNLRKEPLGGGDLGIAREVRKSSIETKKRLRANDKIHKNLKSQEVKKSLEKLKGAVGFFLTLFLVLAPSSIQGSSCYCEFAFSEPVTLKDGPQDIPC